MEIPLSLPGNDLGMGMSIILKVSVEEFFSVLKRSARGPLEVVKYSCIVKFG